MPDNQTSSPGKRCAEIVLDTLPAAMRTIRQLMRSNRLPGLSVPQLRALAFLLREGSATLSQLAEHVGTPLPSMSRMVQSLVEAHLVKRNAGQTDRRTIRIDITPRGQSLLRSARQATLAQLAARMDLLDAGEIRTLTRAMPLLLKLAENRPIPTHAHVSERPC